MAYQAIEMDGRTVNPLAWVEIDFLLFIALLLVLAAIVSYAISQRLHNNAAPSPTLTGLEIAALIDAQTLQNAIEIDLIVRGVLQITETRTLPFSYFAKFQTRFTPAGLDYPLDTLQRWAVAELVAVNSLVWSGSPGLTVVANQGFYSRYRKTLEQKAWLRPGDEIHRQSLAAMAPFLLPFVLLLLWLAQRGATSNAILVELVAAFVAVIFVGSHQISMTPAAYARFQETREEMREKIGANLPREDFVMAFSVLGYVALNGTELERFASYRYNEQNGD